ncbi:hypothetical protein [Vibrio sp. 10N.239.312.D08]|uniref:hypothetical protein n=1 Tax=Vibrio sp. 10N.239.312.D08 TaxID=3229978 RepID=UPI00354DC826
MNGEYSGFVEAKLEDTEVSIIEQEQEEPLTIADLLSGETTVSYYAGSDSDSASPAYCHLTFMVGDEKLYIPAYVD